MDKINKKKGFISRLLDKLDKKLEEKVKNASPCCGTNTESSSSCCGKSDKKGGSKCC